jgi:hypothetical protein
MILTTFDLPHVIDSLNLHIEKITCARPVRMPGNGRLIVPLDANRASLSTMIESVQV